MPDSITGQQKLAALEMSTSSSESTTSHSEKGFLLTSTCGDQEQAYLSNGGKFRIIGYSFMSGVLHLALYNCLLNIAFPLKTAIKDFNPTPVWLPMGSAGSILGNFLFLFVNEPCRLKYLWWCGTNMVVMAALVILFHWMAYERYIGESASTAILGICFMLSEVTRGFLQSINFGMGPYFEKYGVAKYMSVATSAGEGVSGMIPWLIELVFTLCNPYNPSEKYEIIAVETAYIVACLTSIIHIGVLGFTFYLPSGKVLKDNVEEQTNMRTEKRLAQQKADGITKHTIGSMVKAKSKTLLAAVQGTKMAGFGIFLLMCGTLNVYPNVFPFGVVKTSEPTRVTILLGIFTVLDPVFRLLGFVLPKLLGSWVPPKMLYIGMVLVKTIALNPILIYGFYQPFSSMFANLWQNIIIVVALGLSQGALTIFGVYTYMSHLPQTQYTELSASLFVIYLIAGVLVGQGLFNVFPAIQASPLI